MFVPLTGNPTTSNDGYHFKSTGHYISAFQEMINMQRNGMLCDMEIAVGMEVYRVHRLVLASISKYFFDRFYDDGKVKIHIADISPTVVQSIVSFAYTGEILITVDNIEELLFASRKFGIGSLETACGESIPQLLNPTTWIKIKAIAVARNAGGLYQKCHSYALQHFTDIAKTDQFLQLPFKEVKELIIDDELMVPSDMEVYSAVIKWVKYDFPNRGPNLAELMNHVRLPLLDRTYFRNNVAMEPLMRNNFECTKLLLEATEFQSGVRCVPSPRMTPRKSYSVSNAPSIFSPNLLFGSFGLQSQANRSNIFVPTHSFLQSQANPSSLFSPIDSFLQSQANRSSLFSPTQSFLQRQDNLARLGLPTFGLGVPSTALVRRNDNWN